MPTQSIELLQEHMHLLSPEKQAVARYICENWPLTHRLPQGIAKLASSAYGHPVHDVTRGRAFARELILEAAQLARASWTASGR